jgi:hypothetical protein
VEIGHGVADSERDLDALSHGALATSIAAHARTRPHAKQGCTPRTTTPLPRRPLAVACAKQNAHSAEEGKRWTVPCRTSAQSRPRSEIRDLPIGESGLLFVEVVKQVAEAIHDFLRQVRSIKGGSAAN